MRPPRLPNASSRLHFEPPHPLPERSRFARTLQANHAAARMPGEAMQRVEALLKHVCTNAGNEPGTCKMPAASHNYAGLMTSSPLSPLTDKLGMLAFMEPVDEVRHQAPNYHKMIANPQVWKPSPDLG